MEKSLIVPPTSARRGRCRACESHRPLKAEVGGTGHGVTGSVPPADCETHGVINHPDRGVGLWPRASARGRPPHTPQAPEGRRHTTLSRSTCKPAPLNTRISLKGTIAAKLLPYDFERLMEGGTLLKCSEFGEAIVKHPEWAE